MRAPEVATYDTAGFFDRHVQPQPLLQEMVEATDGAFFIIPVQEMLRASRLPVPPVRSSGHTLIFLTSGIARMRIGYAQHTIGRHQCLSVAAGKVFSYEHPDVNEGFLIHFTDTFPLAQLGLRERMREFDFLQPWGQAVMDLPPAAATSIETALGRMLLAFRAREQGYLDLCRAYLIVILHELRAADLACPPQAPPRALALSNRFLELLGSRFRQLHLVQDYADLLAVTPSHLNKAVKAATGKSPSKWVDETLVLEAKVLLYQSDTPVGEIASWLGIQDNSYFSRLFKRYEGMTPIAFRKGTVPS